MVTLGTDFIRMLLTETEPIVSEDDRAMAGDIIRGDLLFCVGCTPVASEYHTLGVGLHVQEWIVPVKQLRSEFEFVSTCCGTGTGKSELDSFYSSGTGGPSLLKGAPHPNATKVFLNWLEGSEGARTYIETSHQAARHCSARVDLQDISVRSEPMQDGKSYVSFDRETTGFFEDMVAELAEEIFGGR